MQDVRPPYGKALPILVVLALLSAVLGFIAVVLGSGKLLFAATVSTTLCALLAVGCWVVSKTVRKHLEAMRNGDVLGSWQASPASDGRLRSIDVGPGVAIVDGRFQLFSGFIQRPASVELRQTELVIHAISNNGYGDRPFQIVLPFDAADIEPVRRCGVAISERFAVGFHETP